MSYYTDYRRYFDELSLHGAQPKILCEGDSWFSIPDLMHIPAQLDRLLDASILCVATPGDTLVDMSEGSQFSLLKFLMNDTVDGQRWDALLLSAGGNDVVGDGMQYFLKNDQSSSSDPADYVNEDALKERLNLLESRLNNIINMRDASSANPNTPIIIHSYTYLTPRNAAHKILAWGVAGPWIYPYMLRDGIVDCALQKEIVAYLLNRYFDLLMSIEERAGSNFHVIDTRFALPRIECTLRCKQSKFWADEIHPTSKGFAILANECFLPKLRVLGVA